MDRAAMAPSPAASNSKVAYLFPVYLSIKLVTNIRAHSTQANVVRRTEMNTVFMHFSGSSCLYLRSKYFDTFRKFIQIIK